MKSIRATILAACTLLVFSGGAAQAAPILWSSGSGGNDHYYDLILVPDPFTGNNNAWSTDSAAASASVFNGVSGHLATVTSQAENDFLLSLVPGGLPDGAGAWLGGRAPQGWLEGPEAGQPFTYTNWGGVEPNNAGFAYMIIGPAFAGVIPGEWADDSFVQGVPDPTFDRVIGYFVEFEGVAVPEPFSWLLLASGLTCLAVRARNSARSTPE
jgi:hypothetical protein